MLSSRTLIPIIRLLLIARSLRLAPVDFEGLATWA